MKRIRITFVTAITVTLLVLIYYYSQALQITTHVQKGTLDLAETNFLHDEVIALDGEWEFYWNQFVDTESFTALSQQASYIQVPGNWLMDLDGNEHMAKGFATYRAVIHNIPDHKYFALKKANIRNASRVYVNGELLLEDGRASMTLKNSVAGNSSTVVYFELEERTAEIVIHAANHEYIVGGIAKPMLFGTQEGLSLLQNRKLMFEFAMILIVMVLGFLYLLLWLGNKHYRKKEPVTLPLALSCLFFGIMNGIYSERIFAQFIPGMTLEHTFRFGHLMSACSVIMVWVVIHKVNPAFLSRRSLYLLLVYYGIFMLLVLIVPVQIYTGTFTFYILTTVLLFFTAWVRVVIQYVRNPSSSPEHRTLLICICSVFLYWLDMILFSVGIKSDMFISFLTVSVYSIALAALLLVRYANSYKRNEELSIQLIQTHTTLDQTTKEAQRNELAFLQAQIKPHFLFNTLSSIISLCYTNGERAGRLLSDLSNYLKRSFQVDVNTDYVTLRNELDWIKVFVDIEKARFEDRIQVDFDVDEDLMHLQIIPLVIEPLVENAIRHGILKNKHGGKVKLIIQKRDNSMFISVKDNGKGMAAEQLAPIRQGHKDPADRTGNGISLLNVNARLKQMYGVQLQFNTNGQGTEVYFSIPLHREQEVMS
ncbi:sensor histidine kinase [Paenibacillus sp. JSM ZJ436]